MLAGLLKKRVTIFSAVGALLIVLVWLSTGQSNNSGVPASWARVDKLERKGDVAGLTQATADHDSGVVARALAALCHVSPPAAREAAQKLADNPNWQIRNAVASTLGTVGDRHQIDVLVHFLTKDPNAAVRSNAAASMGVLRSWDALETLIPALDDPSPAVRSSAHLAIHRILGVDFVYNVKGTSADHAAAIARIRALLPHAKPLYDKWLQRFESKEKSP